MQDGTGTYCACKLDKFKCKVINSNCVTQCQDHLMTNFSRQYHTKLKALPRLNPDSNGVMQPGRKCNIMAQQGTFGIVLALNTMCCPHKGVYDDDVK